MTNTETATAPARPISALISIPDAPRVIYANNPLIEVICQIRFPAVLKVDSALPAAFQERIRGHFPLLEEESAISTDLPPEIARFLSANRTPQLSRRTWKFLSEDGQWAISLARDFAAISTERYTEWKEFRANLEMMWQALQEEYHPSFVTRVGLRYRDQIVRSKLGLADVAWSELLAKHIAAAYSEDSFAPAIKEAAHVIVAEFPEEKMKLGLRHGTVPVENSAEVAYLIDSDLYSDEKGRTDNVLDRLDFFNRMAGRLFRWCIAGRLHDAMEPRRS